MIRILKKKSFIALIFFVVFISATCFWLSSYHRHDVRAALVDAREAVFTRVITSEDMWHASPEELRTQYGFKVDSVSDRQALSDLVGTYVENAEISENQSAFLTIGAMLNNLYYNPPGRCGYFDHLSTRLKYLTSEDSRISGCCSDYTETFIALAASQNYEAREVRKTGHVFAEIYMPNEKSWIWLDPQFSLTAYIEDKAKPLSLFQLRDALLNGREVMFYNHKLKQVIPHLKLPANILRFYKMKDFQNIKMLQGNAIWAEDVFNLKHKAFPKPLRQIYSYFAGVRPYTLSYDGRK